MKKEVLLAIVLGLIVGLVITYGIYNARKAVQTISSAVQQVDLQDDVIMEATDSGVLVLNAPEDNSIQVLTESAASGTTYPNSDVIVFVNNTAIFSKADTKGTFQLPLSLEAGSNIITAVSIDPEGKQARQTRLVVVSSADLDGTPASPSAQLTTQTASASGEDAQQNIKNRIEQVLEDKKGQNVQKPMAYVGVIERVTADAMTINMTSGNKIIQFSKELLIIVDSNQKTVKSTDLEVGSWVIVMGYAKDNAFEARRIVMSKTSLYPTPLTIFAGTVKSLSKSLLLAVSRSEKEATLLLARSIKYQNLSQEKLTVKDIKVSDPFIAFLEETQDATPSATLITILKETEKTATPSGN